MVLLGLRLNSVTDKVGIPTKRLYNVYGMPISCLLLRLLGTWASNYQGLISGGI